MGVEILCVMNENTLRLYTIWVGGPYMHYGETQDKIRSDDKFWVRM